MYLEHFSLAANPFGLSPRLDYLYRSVAFEESMAHLIYGLDNSEAIVMITGAIGSGKTMSLQSFMTNLGDHFASALITNTQINTKELLKLILEDLEVDFPIGCDKSDLLILFKNFLLETSRNGRQVIIVIDEAQNLELSVLEEVRLLTNLGQGERQPVQIILVGQPELADLVQQPGLAQLRQRIRVHYTFDPLTRKEVAAYISHRMAVAGCERNVFQTKALDRIFEYSGGIPRLVNTIAGEALLSAFVAQNNEVSAGDVSPVAEMVPEMAHREAVVEAPPVLAIDQAPPVEMGGAIPVKEVPQPAPPHVYASKKNARSYRWAWVSLGLIALISVLFVYRAEIGNLIGDLAGTDSESEVVARGTMPAVKEAESLEPEGSAKEEVSQAIHSDNMVEDMAQVDVVSEAVIASPEPSEEYFVHIASFRELPRANAHCQRLQQSGQHASVRTQKISGVVWNRVFLGPFVTRESAGAAAEASQSAGRQDYYQILKMPVEPEA